MSRREDKHGSVEKPKKKRRGLWWKIPMWIIIVAAGIFVLTNLVNTLVSVAMRHYIYSFEPVDYSGVDRVVPEKDPETGYYMVTTDRDLKIMMLTDIHIGGGFWTYKNDRKTVAEVVNRVVDQEGRFRRKSLISSYSTATTPSPLRGLYTTAEERSTTTCPPTT